MSGTSEENDFRSTCVVCHEKKNGGIHTNGDGYGDAKHVGIVPPERGFYCWDCWSADHSCVPDIDKEIDAAFAAAGMCGFLEAWVGRCRNPKPCAQHLLQKCWKCDKEAIRNCNETGILVCGVPECAEHSHIEYHKQRYEATARGEQ